MSSKLDTVVANVPAVAEQHKASLAILGVPKETFAQAVIECFLKNPTIANCESDSLKMAVRRCCMDGLIPNGIEAVIIPKKNKDNPDGPKACDYLPMKEGLMKMISRAFPEAHIQAGVVKNCDEVEWLQGSESDITVKKGFPKSKEDNEILGAWARMQLKDGRVYIEMMYRDELDKARRASKTSGHVWGTWTEAMCEKSVIKRLMYRCRYLIASKDILDSYSKTLEEDSDYKDTSVTIESTSVEVSDKDIEVVKEEQKPKVVKKKATKPLPKQQAVPKTEQQAVPNNADPFDDIPFDTTEQLGDL